jgi:hypothetical protein
VIASWQQPDSAAAGAESESSAELRKGIALRKQEVIAFSLLVNLT